jgi:NAD(P)-dependent dehydrogenase (short-subunit alcohol dehydrogenase family)
MVGLSQVRKSNAAIDGSTCPRVALFAGATSGIGQAALQQFVKACKGKGAVKIYVVGRKSSSDRFQSTLEALRNSNTDADLIWIEAEISLLASVKQVCIDVTKRESVLDLLYLSAGYVPFAGRNGRFCRDPPCCVCRHSVTTAVKLTDIPSADTSEGLDVTHALGYYSRILFMVHLLPLLRASKQGRVVTVLAGGMEMSNIKIDDLTLEKPGNFGPMQSQIHNCTMLTLSMEQLAEENPTVAFIHAYPGAINTGNLYRGWGNQRILPALLGAVWTTIIWLFGFSKEESGERTLYLLTTAKFGGQGVAVISPEKPGQTTRRKQSGGLFLVNHKGESVLNEKVLVKLRKKAKDAVWSKTQQILQPYV